MQTSEICPLTQESIARLLRGRQASMPDDGTETRRGIKRWPFPGTVELWIPEADGTERYALATSLNLSLQGVGIRTDEPLPVGTKMAIALHEPEVSFHGHAVVRHCTPIEDDYLMGMQFEYTP